SPPVRSQIVRANMRTKWPLCDPGFSRAAASIALLNAIERWRSTISAVASSARFRAARCAARVANLLAMGHLPCFAEAIAGAFENPFDGITDSGKSPVYQILALNARQQIGDAEQLVDVAGDIVDHI